MNTRDMIELHREVQRTLNAADGALRAANVAVDRAREAQEQATKADGVVVAVLAKLWEQTRAQGAEQADIQTDITVGAAVRQLCDGIKQCEPQHVSCSYLYSEGEHFWRVDVAEVPRLSKDGRRLGVVRRAVSGFGEEENDSSLSGAVQGALRMADTYNVRKDGAA